MLNIIITAISLIVIVILKFALNVKLKEIFKLKKRSNEELEKISEKFDEDEKICNDILKILDNADVKLKKDEDNKSLYIILNNTILLGKFDQEYMKIQTLAHECIHSSQNKFMLWFNYSFSNLYNIYFFIICILTIFNKINNTYVQTILLIFAGMVQYIVRATLEIDAMTKAPYLSKEYLDTKKEFNENEKDKLYEEYKYITNLGINFTNFRLIAKNILRVAIYQILIII